MAGDEPLLTVEHLSSAWGRVPVLRDVSFAIAPGELVSLLGPNGSGKTTLLRCLAGLEPTTGGAVRLAGRAISDLPTHRRGIGLMSQEPALFPNRTVLENIAYAPLLRGASDRDVRGEVAPLLELLRLDGFEDRRPGTLSGGERQRVALARTLAARPALLLLDEPFAAIDREVRAELRADFRTVLRRLGTAALHVTHDREDGLFLADRVGLLFDGRLVALDRPAEIYARPPSSAAARLLGYNIVPTPDGAVAVDPSDVRLEGPTPDPRSSAVVVAAGTTGRESLIVVELPSGVRLEARGERPSFPVLPGTPVGVRFARTVPLPGADPAVPLGPGAKEPKKEHGLARR